MTLRNAAINYKEFNFNCDKFELMIHDFDPVLINFGFIQVRWYSLAYVLGILIGWWYGKLLIKKIIPAIDQKKYI